MVDKQETVNAMIMSIGQQRIVILSAYHITVVVIYDGFLLHVFKLSRIR